MSSNVSSNRKQRLRKTKAQLIDELDKLESEVAHQKKQPKNRAKKTLMESEQRFKAIAETASDRFWEMDENFQFTANIDPKGNKYPIDSERFIGCTRWEAAGGDPEREEKWRNHREDHLAHRPYRNFQFTIPADDGKTLHLSVSGSPIFDDTGTLKGYLGSTTNITDRIKAEEEVKRLNEELELLVEERTKELLRSEMLFRTVVNHSPTKIHIKDLEGRYILINREAEKLFGITDKDGRGKTTGELFDKDVADAFKTHDEKVIETGEAFEEEEEFTLNDGVHTYLTTKFPIFNQDGLTGIGAIGTDITERKKAEDVASRLMEAIEGLSENFALYGPDEKMVMCNRNYRELNEAISEATRPGVSYEEHMRAIVDKGLAPKAMGREEEYIRERMERYRNPTGPYEVVRQDGVWLIHEQRAGGGSMAIIATNITQLKQAEEAALKSQARLTEIFNIAPEAVITVGTDMNIQLFNKGAERIFGYDAEEILGQSLEILMPETFRKGHQKHIEGFDGSKDTYRLMDQRQEIYGLRKDGTEFPASASVSKLEIGGEKIYTVMLQDITERKHIQDAMIAAKNEAETATRAKSEFLAAMSHDLRTPLNAILGFADILTNQYFGPINDKYREYAEDIHSSGEHLLTLVNEILDLSTIEAGKQSLVKEELSTLEIVTECERIIEEKARALGIDLIMKVPKSPPPLYADKRAAKQILLNLLSNAVKFTPEGGKITLSVNGSKRKTTFKVADTGRGIPAERLPNLTDPFVRADADPYRAEQGWGLGLSITKSLVDLHNGEMDIKSKVGKGTTVTVTFSNRAP